MTTAEHILAPARAALIDVIRQAGPQTYRVQLSTRRHIDITLRPDGRLDFSGKLREYQNGWSLEDMLLQDLTVLALLAAEKMEQATAEVPASPPPPRTNARPASALNVARMLEADRVLRNEQLYPPGYKLASGSMWVSGFPSNWNMAVDVACPDGQVKQCRLDIDFHPGQATVKSAQMLLIDGSHCTLFTLTG